MHRNWTGLNTPGMNKLATKSIKKKSQTVSNDTTQIELNASTKAYFIQQCCEKQCTNQRNHLVEGILISGNKLLDCNENQLS